MARLTRFTFSLDGQEYAVGIDFDDAALVDDTVAFDLLAERIDKYGPRQTIAARVEIRPADRSIKAYVQGRLVLDLDGFATEPKAVERAVDAIPAEYFIDPVTACAIKAGISAIIGQSIACFRSLENDGRWKRVPEFLHCMAGKFSAMSKVAMYRAFKCIATFGGLV